MKLTVDFSALFRAVAPLNYAVDDFEIASQTTELDSVAKDLAIGQVLGGDIQLEDIDGSQGILNYDGHQVMLYIPDQYQKIVEVLHNGQQGRKVHVAECSTLESMRNSGRFSRYDVISRMDGLFPVFGIDPTTNRETSGEARLNVCKNCLKILNYRGFEVIPWVEKNAIVSQFDFEAFFETYSSFFKSLPEASETQTKAADYTPDWSAISSRYRRELDYHCEHCGVYLKDYTRLLHVHHINGNKTDNRRENLRGLCADCHKKQPHHGHLHVSRDDALTINTLRREQHKFDVFDYDRLQAFSDTALEGLNRKCRHYNLPTPDLGVMVKCSQKLVSIDLAWPRRKVAVLINPEDQPLLQATGWTVFTLGAAMKQFELFQNKVR
ncbi:HNH endonuclease [Endozoicomonas euniceicola]|uniref:HNH endonuclease n=1 Tax=Endozoicomonas euniceicola TaxID=1234143 RepID=A0ABY6GRV5_9GAMM|nr:HNH endonuclease [Endozoicomonas euniceicola]UYM15302.1 HNH endonuclease [Endozoicomonas euniceicola]